MQTDLAPARPPGAWPPGAWPAATEGGSGALDAGFDVQSHAHRGGNVLIPSSSQDGSHTRNSQGESSSLSLVKGQGLPSSIFPQRMLLLEGGSLALPGPGGPPSRSRPPKGRASQQKLWGWGGVHLPLGKTHVGGKYVVLHLRSGRGLGPASGLLRGTGPSSGQASGEGDRQTPRIMGTQGSLSLTQGRAEASPLDHWEWSPPLHPSTFSGVAGGCLEPGDRRAGRRAARLQTPTWGPCPGCGPAPEPPTSLSPVPGFILTSCVQASGLWGPNGHRSCVCLHVGPCTHLCCCLCCVSACVTCVGTCLCSLPQSWIPRLLLTQGKLRPEGLHRMSGMSSRHLA